MSKLPKGFIELNEPKRDGWNGHHDKYLINTRNMTVIQYRDFCVVVVADVDFFYVRETYEEILAKIKEAQE